MDRISLNAGLKKAGVRLIEWYIKNHRDLPWRQTRDPYLIWVSESILQQTRVAQGIDYYNRFTALFPDIYTLASAHPDEVMKAWQGLGYYNRARNLHEAARYVVNDLGGKIPSTYDGLLKMKGIGPYIAAAIASFAFNERIPVVDGNVIRFLSRLAGIYATDRKIFISIANDIMGTEEPHLFNQAIMEFGALQCIPGLPRCTECPFSEKCYAYTCGKINNLPVKKKRTDRKKRYFHYFVIIKQDGFIMKKRDKSDIWKGLYDFPLIQTNRPVSVARLRYDPAWTDLFDNQEPNITATSPIFRHILSHQVIYAKFYRINDDKIQIQPNNSYYKISFNKVSSIPVPRLIENFIKKTDWQNRQI
jgi:A/G-specific adenine glycosylase